MKVFSLIFVFSLALLLVQCTDPPISPPTDESLTLFAGGRGGGNGGGGGGGHTETMGNNLSFPALLADGYSVTPITETLFTVPYTGDYEGLTAEQIAWLEANGPWYAQKVEGNVWQAEYLNVTTVDVSYIDWGDAIEAVNPKMGRPYRLELVLYEDVSSMLAYKMAELAYPSSKDETQGTNTLTYNSIYASVASPSGEIVVQRFEGVDPTTLTWDGSKWVGAEAPVPISFQVENNVGGKLIFGASMKGWKPTELGAHRITFYLANSSVILSNAYIANYTVDELGNQTYPMPVAVGETNTPFVDAVNNLTYVDVIVTTGGGGGGGH